EPGHRPGVQPQRTGREDQVGALHAGVLQADAVEGGIVGAGEPGFRIGVREQERELLGEIQVVADDHRHRGGQGLVQIALAQRRLQPLLGLGRTHEHEARRAHVGTGGAPLEHVVELAQGVLSHLAAEHVVGAGGAEQAVEGLGAECVLRIHCVWISGLGRMMPRQADKCRDTWKGSKGTARHILRTHVEQSMPGSPVWTIPDGNAGNVRQAHALAAALGRPIRDWSLAPRAPWRWTAPRRLPADHVAFGRDFADALAAPPGLAIGCGRQSALATRLLRARGTRVVQILDPRLDPRHWDLVVAPEHDGLDGPNVIRLLGSLHPVDEAWLAQAHAHYTALATLPRPRTSLLLGGNSGHARLDEAFLHATLDVLLRQLRQEGGSLMATTSRRTPAGFAEQLRKRLAGYESLVWTGPRDGANPYPGLLAHADRIVCTGDS